MSITTVTIEDAAAFIGYQDTDDTTGAVTYRRVWKPGSEQANRRALHDKLTLARDFFGTQYANWPTMTPAQKDAANRQAMRALANLAAYLLRDSGTGV